MSPGTLGDLGERRILQEIVPRYAVGVGDDCAVVGRLDGHVVVTTDPVPPPAARILGGDDDLYWLGWLLVTINASDIAASGAVPQAFVAALEMPPSLPVTDLERLLAGISASCKANGLAYVGGNLRESTQVGGVGTAIGVCKHYPLTRSGAAEGDSVLVIGEGGRFWADVERLRLGMGVDRSASPVFSPVSQAKTVHHLHNKGLLACAMDTSDGLAPTLVELAKKNNLRIRITLEALAQEHQAVCERPERLWMGWGDWNVVAAVRAGAVEAVKNELRLLGTSATFIGEFVDGEQGVVLASRSSEIPLGRLESERFAKDSWFIKGVEEYRRLLHLLSLPND